MAKLFYSLEEAAQRLNMSPEEVQKLVSSGQLQEFRETGSGRLVFKRQQVDLLAGGGEPDAGGSGSGVIPLADSGELEGVSLAQDSGVEINVESPKEQSGISVFDAESTELADPSAQTRVTDTAPGAFDVDLGSSGSGLLDLTREADDTSLGAGELLEDLAGAGEATAGGAAPDTELFEQAPGETELGAGVTPAAALVLAERIEGGWSGFSGGLALGMVVVVGAAVMLTVGGLTGAPPQTLLRLAQEQFYVVVGGAVGVLALFGLIGGLIGRRS